MIKKHSKKIKINVEDKKSSFKKLLGSAKN